MFQKNLENIGRRAVNMARNMEIKWHRKDCKITTTKQKKTKKKEDPDAVDVMVWEGSKRADGKKMEKRQE